MPHLSIKIGDSDYFSPLIPSGKTLFHYQINSTTELKKAYSDISTGLSGTETVKWLCSWNIEVTEIASGANLRFVQMFNASYGAILYLSYTQSTGYWALNNSNNIKGSIYRERTKDELSILRIGHQSGSIRVHFLDIWIWE